jgi:hypothetical protein
VFSVRVLWADGTRCDLTNSVRLHVKLLSFTWKYEFKVLNGGPFPIILGLDFLRRTSMVVDVASKRYSFRFAPQCSGEFGDRSEETGGDPFFRSLVAQVSEVVGNQAGGSDDFNVGVFSSEFPALFSSTLGTEGKEEQCVTTVYCCGRVLPRSLPTYNTGTSNPLRSLPIMDKYVTTDY